MKALVFGASGNLGSYLAEFLVRKGYQVTGTYSGTNLSGGQRPEGVKMVMTPFGSQWGIRNVIEETKPDEVYNCVARMFAPNSWMDPIGYMEVNAMAVARILDSVYKFNPEARVWQAGSAEVFGKLCFGRFNENTPLRPESPYGVAKATAHELIRVYREKHRKFACTGILFNAESPRRSDFFFASKVAKAAARHEKLELGELGAGRDWGLAEEYVEAAWMMLQTPIPKDYIIATGVTASCQDFVDEARKQSEFQVSWKVPRVPKIDTVYADPSAIEEDLGWKANTKFPEVVGVLVKAELPEVVHG